MGTILDGNDGDLSASFFQGVFLCFGSEWERMNTLYILVDRLTIIKSNLTKTSYLA
jgi:hypothetical protein